MVTECAEIIYRHESAYSSGQSSDEFLSLVAAPDSDLAQELTKDPYIFDFTEMTEPYDYLYISAGDRILDIEPDSDAFDRMLQEIIVALKQEADLLEKAIEDSERAMEARKEADKECSYDEIYRQLLDGVRAELKKLGWEGDYRVFTSGNYNILWCLGLKISPVSECYFSGTPEEVLANVRDLYNFAMIQLRQQAILGRTDISRMKNGSIEAMESSSQILIDLR